MVLGDVFPFEALPTFPCGHLGSPRSKTRCESTQVAIESKGRPSPLIPSQPRGESKGRVPGGVHEGRSWGGGLKAGSEHSPPPCLFRVTFEHACPLSAIEVQDGREGPETVQERSKVAQDSLQTAQETPKTPQEGSKSAPKRVPRDKRY